MSELTMPFAVGDATPERVRECDCPPWVTRCSHFGGRTLAVVTETTESKVHATSCGYRSATHPFAVAVITYFDNCPRCGTYRAHADERYWPSQFDNEADAITAFEAEEARLLGREVQP